jgi:hypothetical protein
MLEQRTLLLRPRSTSGVQVILDGESGVPLGFARWQPAASPGWRRLLARRVLAVHEQEDESLLFTIRRTWGLLPRREVQDADDQFVGSLLGRLIHDRFGRPVAALRDGVFFTPSHRALAELAATPDGLRLWFGPAIAGEPFIKMLLLAAALQLSA